MEYRIDVYQTKSGKRPFIEWLTNLKDKEARQKIRVRLERLALGNLGNSDKIENGIHELRIDYGPGYRVYFANNGMQKILILSGGTKRSQKNDIQAAKNYFMDYKMRGKYYGTK